MENTSWWFGSRGQGVLDSLVPQDCNRVYSWPTITPRYYKSSSFWEGLCGCPGTLAWDASSRSDTLLEAQSCSQGIEAGGSCLNALLLPCSSLMISPKKVIPLFGTAIFAAAAREDFCLTWLWWPAGLAFAGPIGSYNWCKIVYQLYLTNGESS